MLGRLELRSSAGARLFYVLVRMSRALRILDRAAGGDPTDKDGASRVAAVAQSLEEPLGALQAALMPHIEALDESSPEPRIVERSGQRLHPGLDPVVLLISQFDSTLALTGGLVPRDVPKRVRVEYFEFRKRLYRALRDLDVELTAQADGLDGKRRRRRRRGVR